MIEVKKLYKAFKENSVLSDISFRVEEGQTVVIIGKSGTGKSVLLKNMIGLLHPDSGEIWIDNQMISAMSFKDLQLVRAKIGMVFQAGALFDSLTVGENIELALNKLTDMSTKNIKNRMLASLMEVNMEGTEKLFPSELSGGMKKRVGIARAIAFRPKYLFYDEPTTGLDPIMTDIINKLILKFQRNYNITSVIVTHERRTVFDVAERVIMLDKGKICFNGSSDEIQNSEVNVIRQFITGNSEMKMEAVT